MKKKKAGRKPARIDIPEEQRTEEETKMHYNAVLMEDLDSKFRLVLERVDALDVKFEKKIDNLEIKMDERFSSLEHAVKTNSERISTLEKASRGLKEDMIDMERRICSKINRITDCFENHELRISSLEARN